MSLISSLVITLHSGPTLLTSDRSARASDNTMVPWNISVLFTRILHCAFHYEWYTLQAKSLHWASRYCQSSSSIMIMKSQSRKSKRRQRNLRNAKCNSPALVIRVCVVVRAFRSECRVQFWLKRLALHCDGHCNFATKGRLLKCPVPSTSLCDIYLRRGSYSNCIKDV